MPVPHGHKAVGIESVIAQFGLQRLRLAFSVPADGRASSDAGVVVLYLAGAGGRNQLGEGLAADAGEREINNVWIAE